MSGNISVDQSLPSERLSTAIDPERVRFRGENVFADELVATGIFSSGTAIENDRPDCDRIRRRLLTTHIKLTENMVPEVFEYLKAASTTLGITKPVEIYQASGDENAANWRNNDIVFVSLQGQLTSLLDRESFIALLGHEFGHHLAHTNPTNGDRKRTAIDLAVAIAYDNRLPEQVRTIASRLCMGQEFTADRFAALATTSLDGPLRLFMTLVTGLPAQRLLAETPAYLEQAKALFSEANKAETATLGSHPEHLLRAYALVFLWKLMSLRS